MLMNAAYVPVSIHSPSLLLHHPILSPLYSVSAELSVHLLNAFCGSDFQSSDIVELFLTVLSVSLSAILSVPPVSFLYSKNLFAAYFAEVILSHRAYTVIFFSFPFGITLI